MINISAPALIGNERKYVLDCIDKCELSWHGEYIARFEEAFAEFCDVKYAVACSSGTTALHLALIALDIGPGQDVFLPSLTYIATANAVRYVGANPVFCDIDCHTWCLDSRDVEAKLRDNPRTRYKNGRTEWKRGVILPVHLYGVPADIDSLKKLSNSYGLQIVEDACEAHGATYKGQRVGSLGTIAAFSFFANKIITTGEGGMLTTNDPVIAEKIRHYRGQGQTEKRYFHDVVGYNYRMTNIQAAIGLAQLEQFDEHQAVRAHICKMYEEAIPFTKQSQLGANWLYTVLLPNELDRDTVIAKMLDKGIETRPVFVPITDMPPYKSSVNLPATQFISNHGISLPTHVGLLDGQINQVIDTFLKITRI